MSRFWVQTIMGFVTVLLGMLDLNLIRLLI